MSKFGLAKELKKIDKYISTSRIVNEDKYIFLQALKDSTYEKKQALEQKVVQLAEQLNHKITKMKQAAHEYRELKKTDGNGYNLKDIRKRLKEMQHNFRMEWKSWRMLEKEVSAHAILQHHHT